MPFKSIYFDFYAPFIFSIFFLEFITIWLWFLFLLLHLAYKFPWTFVLSLQAGAPQHFRPSPRTNTQADYQVCDQDFPPFLDPSVHFSLLLLLHFRFPLSRSLYSALFQSSLFLRGFFNLSSNHSGSPLAADSNLHGMGGVTLLVKRRKSFCSSDLLRFMSLKLV